MAFTFKLDDVELLVGFVGSRYDASAGSLEPVLGWALRHAKP